MKLLIVQSSPASHYFLSGTHIFLSTMFSGILNLCSSLCVRVHVSHPYKTKTRITVLYILVFFERRRGDKRFCTEF